MFYRYEIRNNYGKECLYLYLTMNEEVSQELGNNDSTTMENRVKNYIKSRNIDYDGEDVFLVVDGIIVKSLNIKDKDIRIETLDDKSDYVNIKYLVTIRNNGKEKIIPLKDYLTGVMFTNKCYLYPEEVRKALCILYRTYVYYKMEKDGFIDYSDRFMLYKDMAYYKLAFIDNYHNFYDSIISAIDDTDCIFITYENNYILPFIHLVNNGYTDEDSNYPYLEKRYSLWDLLSPSYMEIKEFTYNYLEKVFNIRKSSIQELKIIELTSGNRVSKLKLGELILTGEDFRERLNLASTDMTILINDKSIKIITRGQGNSLGLSISGSCELAKSGCNYLQILDYYFPKCIIKKHT